MIVPSWSNAFSLSGFAARALQAWHRGGWVGVDLFFVLSGFLVSGLLFKEERRFGRITPGRFLLRRGLKIYPAFWVLLLTTVAVGVATSPLSWRTFLSEFLFVQNYGPALWGHTWSLAIEEHFYLLLVALLAVVHRVAPKATFSLIPKLFLMVAVGSLAARVWLGRAHSFDMKAQILPSHLRLDSLFFGVLLAYFYHYHSDRFRSLAKRLAVPVVGVGALALSLPFFYPLETTWWMPSFGLTLFYLGSGLILFGTVTRSFAGGRVLRTIAYVGSHSYSIYLWHLPVLAWLMPLVGRVSHRYWIYAVLYIVTALFLGIAMARLVEMPILRLRDRLFPSSARPLETGEKAACEPAPGGSALAVTAK
jgi:peptidoglycan/LPS O-acetylase OafA/YrhL